MEKYEPPHDVAGSLVLKRGGMEVRSDPDEGLLMIGRSSDGKWRCTAYLSLNERNELVVFRLEVRPWTDDVHALLTTDLRNLPLNRWLVAAHSWLAKSAANRLSENVVPPRRRRTARRIAKSTVSKPGPKGYGDEFYRWLVLEYLEMQADPEYVRGIRRTLAARASKRLGRPFSEIQARDALNRATEKGFLAPGSSGRAGRWPGPNLYADENQEES